MAEVFVVVLPIEIAQACERLLFGAIDAWPSHGQKWREDVMLVRAALQKAIRQPFLAEAEAIDEPADEPRVAEMQAVALTRNLDSCE
jgi:hypothetical protein